MLLLILFVGFTNLEKDWGHHVEIFLSVPFRDSRGEHTNLQPFQKMVMNSSTLLNMLMYAFKLVVKSKILECRPYKWYQIPIQSIQKPIKKHYKSSSMQSVLKHPIYSIPHFFSSKLRHGTAIWSCPTCWCSRPRTAALWFGWSCCDPSSSWIGDIEAEEIIVTGLA